MSLYGLQTDDPREIRAAYAEVEQLGAREALRRRLARIREREDAARAERQRQEALREHLRRVTRGEKRRAIFREVLDANPGVTLADLVGPSRLQRIVGVRQLVMFRLNQELGLSLPQIGQMFNRDHTTVLSAVRKICGAERPHRRDVNV